MLHGNWPCPCFMNEAITQRREGFSGVTQRGNAGAGKWLSSYPALCHLPGFSHLPYLLGPPTPASKSLPHGARLGELERSQELAGIQGVGLGQEGKREDAERWAERGPAPRGMGGERVSVRSGCGALEAGQPLSDRQTVAPGLGCWYGMGESLHTEAGLGRGSPRTVEASWD